MVRAVGPRGGAEAVLMVGRRFACPTVRPCALELADTGLPEGLTGTVLSIQQCPQPPPGPGRLVLTTVNHLNRDVIELDLRGADGKLETLRPTGNHKFYSVTRKRWLSAAELREGEQLDGVAGLVTVAAKRTLPGTHRVYNLTVQGEHLYRVAQSGVLVHNTCHGHHPIPKFMGGFDDQVLYRVDAATHHRPFHSLLNRRLQEAGLPPGGGRGWSRDVWIEMMQEDPHMQRRSLDTLLETAREYDYLHGTDYTRYVWENIVKGNFRIYP